jgi:hypothetical protein
MEAEVAMAEAEGAAVAVAEQQRARAEQRQAREAVTQEQKQRVPQEEAIPPQAQVASLMAVVEATEQEWLLLHKPKRKLKKQQQLQKQEIFS